MSTNNEIQLAIKKFNQLLTKYSDNKNSTFYFVSFLKQFLRMNNNNSNSELCLSSFITIIKHEMPIVFYELRKRGEYDDVINFMVHLSVDYHKAKADLDNLSKKTNMKAIL
ncbi:hypothetical protein JOC75_000761 [Metabacillus crassostreae]|uniref:hypothetical protein n=1 Tax=Metabacillus crassostreae TaxID=929098 RepID=UPI00195AC87F|nr:hypothetical protein [Metabacillus crassostreae]MBM7602791.1 hypothetical protein [Metabacillus crassostreae]